MKTEVVITADDQYKEYKKGDIGYIDGYIRGGDGRPYAAVVLNNGSIVLVPTHSLKVTYTSSK